MPYPSQINLDSIVEAARRLVEAGGLDYLSLGRVAGELGVKAPSLYGHVGSKDDLLRAVNTRTVALLFEAIHAALDAAPDDPAERLLSVAQAFRAFAHANPHTYVLAMADPHPARQPAQLRSLALAAFSAAREADDPAAAAAARAAGLAASSAYTHPLADVQQTKHIVGPAAYADRKSTR